jgi:hypothetical protein
LSVMRLSGESLGRHSYRIYEFRCFIELPVERLVWSISRLEVNVKDVNYFLRQSIE